MVLAVFFLLVLTVSQVFPASVLKLRSLEIRQSGCPVCGVISDTIANCTTPECFCNLNVAAEVQACVTCGVTGSPTPDNIAGAQKLIDAFQTGCGSVSGLPSITMPPGTPSVTVTPTTGSSISVSVPSGPVTVTSASIAPTIVRSTVSSIQTTGLGTSSGPPNFNANKGRQAGFAVVAAMVGAALVL